MPLETLKVVPANVELKPGETQAFEAVDADNKPLDGVEWAVAEPGVGTIGKENGVYSAPRRVYTSRKLAVVARRLKDQVETAHGSAVIDLDPSRSWVPVLGTGWVVLFALLLAILLWQWPNLCPQCAPSGLFVSPPVVTLAGGQGQQFLASSNVTANPNVTWTNTVNAAGLYIAPSSIAADQVVTITATSTEDPRQSAMGVVRLSPLGSLSILPARATVVAGSSVQLTPSMTGPGTVSWLPPSAGKIDSNGLFVAPSDPQPQAIVVLAQATIPKTDTVAASTLLGGALITVVPPQPGPCDTPGSVFWRVILLVALVGALGGLTHAMGSFGTYVGNRELKASWLWWYGLKPALSAAVAVLVYMVFRAGLGAPDLGLAAADCLEVAGFAGLVGLFAEPATVKLKDVFEAIFTPRRDPREDKAGQASAPSLPEISGLDKKEIKVGQATQLKITGKNFGEAAVVQIGSKPFTARRISATELQVDIPANSLTVGQQPVVVFNKPPSGEASKADSINVTA